MNVQTEEHQEHQKEATKAAEARAAEKAEELARVREIYDANRNNAIEEMLDTFGVWPYREKSEQPTAMASATVEGEEKEEEKRHCSGSIIRKNIQVTKDGVRVAYGGGK